MAKKVSKALRSIKDLQPDPKNANAGSEAGQAMVEWSLEHFGAARSIVADKNGVVGIGNKTMQAAADLGLPIEVVESDGKRLVVVQRTDLDFVNDPEARALAIADNRAAQVGLVWDAEMMKQVQDAAPDTMKHFISPGELDAMLAELHQGDNLGVSRDAKPNPRKLPLDVIYTLQGADASCCIAILAGLKYGINSSTFRLCPCESHFTGRHRVTFVDNNYFEYDHDVHLSVVKRFRPKYATVRDYMSPEQCEHAGIKHYSLSRVLDWAEELAEYAQNVIVVPKVDCIDRIPEKFMLGYSVPSSHGSTPLPAKAFQGRRVHLLGGSWKAQLAYMAALGDDVVSLDNNWVGYMAGQFGAFILPDGETKSVAGVPEISGINNARYVALALSFGAMGTKVNELYRGGYHDASEEREQEGDESTSGVGTDSARAQDQSADQEARTLPESRDRTGYTEGD